MKSPDFTVLEQRVLLSETYRENYKCRKNILRRINKSYGTKGGSKYRNRIRSRLSVLEREFKSIKTKMVLIGIDIGNLLWLDYYPLLNQN